MSATRTLAIANQKGGVGKTTTAINLGTALASIGERVLVLDLDPQGNASTGLGIAIEGRPKTTYDVLTGGAGLLECALPTAVPGLYVVPANNDLVGIDAVLTDTNRPYRLRDAVSALGRPPALAAGRPGLQLHPDRLPAVAEPADAQRAVGGQCRAGAGAVRVLRAGRHLAAQGVDRPDPRHAQPERWRSRASCSPCTTPGSRCRRRWHEEVRAFFGPKVYETIIPRNTRVAEAPSHGKPILLYDFDCAGSQAYIKLATEIIERERRNQAA